jgi:hypothetical protein
MEHPNIIENICIDGTHEVFIASIQNTAQLVDGKQYPRVIFTFKSDTSNLNIQLRILVNTQEAEDFLGRLANQVGAEIDTTIPLHELLGKSLIIKTLNNKITHTLKPKQHDAIIF